MSWSVVISGPRADVVAALQREQANPYRCPQPEQQIKQHALGLALAAVDSQPDEIAAVAVEAHGHNYAVVDVPESNAVTVVVRPVPPSPGA